MNNNSHTPSEKDTKIHLEDPDTEMFDNVQEAAGETDSQLDEANDMLNNEINQVDALTAQLDQAKAQVEKEKKEYLFLMAEFDNFRKRTLKEKSDLIKSAAETVIKGLLPIVDDFERGLQASENSQDPAEIRKGMELIYQKLIKYLEQNGVKAIDSTGKPFDPELHEAIAMVPAQSEDQKGIVIDTPTKGYTLNDKVIRHAKVAVGQ